MFSNEFVWWVVVVCKVIFRSNPTTVLRLCFVVVRVVTICFNFFTLSPVEGGLKIEIVAKKFVEPRLLNINFKTHKN